jgi:hypothetical protein
MAQQTQQTQQQAAQAAMIANTQNRAALLHSGTRMRKNLGVKPAVPGAKLRFKLDNIGVLTSVDFVVTCTVNITAPTTISNSSAEALLPLVALQDYDGVYRVQSSARQLRQLNSYKMRQLKDAFARTFDSDTAGTPAPLGEALLRKVPTANNAAAPFRFGGRIPVAYEPNTDLRGAIVTQTVRGELYVEFTPAALILGADDDSVYKAGTAVINAGTLNIQVFQNYIMPQAIGNDSNGNPVIPIPAQDVVTVYELAGAQSSNANLAVNQDAKYPYPNVRTIMSALFTFMNGGVLNYGTDLVHFNIRANGTTDLIQDDGLSILDRQRNLLGGCDGLAGTYLADSRQVPIETSLFGNVEADLMPSSVAGGNTYVEFMYESFYLKGTQLPGIAVG